MGNFFEVLTKTRNKIITDDAMAWTSLQDGLIMADVGAREAAAIIQDAQKISAEISPAEKLTKTIINRLMRIEASLAIEGQTPFVIMVMGVNGCGKTTTIAKLCHYFSSRRKKVLLAAGDTFRAAAKEQLAIWAKRAGAVEFIVGKDPGAVAFDGAQAAQARGCDIAIIDTAGRLPTQQNLMAELGKIRRAAAKALPSCPHELMLVVDATLGRNTLRQIEAFSAAVGVTGLVLSKLDGSAKGGFLLTLAEQLPRPIRFVGLGESDKDLATFNADEYARALTGF